MACALCKEREANATNTHYLTDSIIRSCLNLGGSNNREQGFYFDLSNKLPSVEFNFQRATPVSSLEDSLGRPPSEEEIERAKKVPFSVDYVFCNDCEKLFTEIENQFIKDILPKLRNVDLTNVDELSFEQTKTTRLFFLLQVWRTAVIEDTFNLPSEVLEKIRISILNHKTVDEDDIKQFPLSVTYLETTGGKEKYTSNQVGFTSDIEPNIILMNDFVIQFYTSPENVRFNDSFGLNDSTDFEQFVNYREQVFKVKVIKDDKRRAILYNFILESKAKPLIEFYKNSLVQFFQRFAGVTIGQDVIQEYLTRIIGNDSADILKYSREEVLKLTYEFVLEKMRIQ